MRKFIFFAATVAGLYGAVLWWRQNRRVGTDFVNRIINPGWYGGVSSAAHAVSSV